MSPSIEQRGPHTSAHITPPAALLSSCTPNNFLFFPINHQRVRKKKVSESGRSLHLSSFLKRAAEVKMFVFRAEEDILVAEMLAIWILCTCCLETAAGRTPCFRCCLTCQKLKFIHSLISLQFLLTHWP